MNIMPWYYFTTPSERIYWVYLITSLLLALILLIIENRTFPSSKTILAWLKHPDTRLDVVYFLVSWFIKMLIIAPLLISAHAVTLFIYRYLSRWISPLENQLSYTTLMVLYTLSLFIFSDFTRYWLHRFLHTNRFLWAFHKVHHSPECLNPLSFYRVHPVENFLFGIRYALSAGIVTGIFFTLFGMHFSLFTLLGANGVIVIFSALGANLRHSPVRLSYGKWLEYFFISPAQHQIHHSTRHMHYNYGGYLAIWDWLFGSLKRNEELKHPLQFGLGYRQREKYDTILKLIINPFKESVRLVKRYIHRS